MPVLYSGSTGTSTPPPTTCRSPGIRRQSNMGGYSWVWSRPIGGSEGPCWWAIARPRLDGRHLQVPARHHPRQGPDAVVPPGVICGGGSRGSIVWVVLVD